MFTELVLLAEGAASHGPSPAIIGIGAFIILMSLLGITYLFSGMHPKDAPQQRDSEANSADHGH